MKNIHVLPTPNPSRLFVYDGKLGLAKESQYGSDAIQNQHIYITNDEVIKEGDWFYDLDLNKLHQYIHSIGVTFNTLKKIILTTDQDLIGVQAIDDEFLEWFINNTSCEEFEVVKEYKHFTSELYGYKIIIPKEGLSPFDLQESPMTDNEFYQSLEEPKQETLEEDCSCTDECLGYLTMNCKGIETLEQIDQNNPVTRGSTALLYKQETLEEVAERIVKSKVGLHYFGNENSLENLAKKEYVIEGAKWQQEQDMNKYSEEEVLEILKDFRDNIPNDVYVVDWFKQFKKK